MSTSTPGQRSDELQKLLTQKDQEIAGLKISVAGAVAQKDQEVARRDQEIDTLKKVMSTSTPGQRSDELQKLLTQKDQEIAGLKISVAGAVAQKDQEVARRDQEIDTLKKVMSTSTPGQRSDELQKLLTQKDQEIAGLKISVAGAVAQKDQEVARRDQEIDTLKKVMSTSTPGQRSDELQKLLTQKDQEIAGLKISVAGAVAQKDQEVARRDQEIDTLKKVMSTSTPGQRSDELQKLLTQKDQEIAGLKISVAGAVAQKDQEVARRDQEIDTLKKVMSTSTPGQRSDELQKLLTQKDQEIAGLKISVAGAVAQKDH